MSSAVKQLDFRQMLHINSLCSLFYVKSIFCDVSQSCG